MPVAFTADSADANGAPALQHFGDVKTLECLEADALTVAGGLKPLTADSLVDKL